MAAEAMAVTTTAGRYTPFRVVSAAAVLTAIAFSASSSAGGISQRAGMRVGSLKRPAPPAR
jgi:hypothetical protein